jgi:hypothetical protein
MWSHEHAPLTRYEETELRLIGQRLWRDGMRLDRGAGQEWRWQLGAVLAAAFGGLMVGSVGWLPPGTVAVVDVMIGALLIVAALVVGPTPVRRRALQAATAVHWRVTARLGALRRGRRHHLRAGRRGWPGLRRAR